MCDKIKYRALPSSLFYILIFLITLNGSLSQISNNNCILDIQFSSRSNSNCELGNWGGFINRSCCGAVFDDYLRALGRQANLTGKIFLNSTEQSNCLASMKEFDKDVLGCHIEKLTSGAGGCSDYTVEGIVNKLSDSLKILAEGCKNLSSDGRFDQACTACLRGWEDIGGPSDDDLNNGKATADVCRFAVLVTLVGIWVDNAKWIQAVFKCLEEQPLALDEKGNTGSSNIKASTASDESLSKESSCLKIAIKEVYSATNNLSASNYIGQGVAGKVYKGILSNGQQVAVKHIISDGYVDTFVREVRSLSHVQHPNLVALLSYCEDHNECFLVYELCHNGNLSEWLYGKAGVLSWIQRLKIAIDSATGLWFLHTYPEGCIIHRDIKPTNILINADFQAKLSDFGLSKVMDIGQSYVSSEVRGTFGYVDPEYRRNHHVSTSGDVYSFGVVLLQLLSGQRVINLGDNRPMPLDKMAKFVMRGGNIAKFADPKINGEYSVEAFDLVFKLALSCTGLKQQRPSMEQVVLRLEKALDISKTSNSYRSHHNCIDGSR
ncbi:probable serine/threonine-protein kinase PBL28 [Citrus clementina]|uniref:probable serine/threonine-protein kinase PBL28 n=1 Tax=Citrus clementina TaxID=85681 RepID=UPI000CED0489|nr:probable serine/threonine-protein kinase PBL28 [Citrus x clementina]